MQRTPKVIPVSIILSIFIPMIAIAEPIGVPYEQDFILTAYYSPLVDQCCYVKGGVEADKYLNGQGIAGADGTKVYPGMLAAPPSFAFGTRINLPGLGVMTVHDRGGAIQVQGNAVRLDVWAGHGEEGLARALAFGVKRIRGTVYPVNGEKPAENFSLSILPAPFEKLKPFLVADAGLIDVSTKAGDKSLSVMLLQQKLKELGIFTGSPTGFFGPDTENALKKFNEEYGLGTDGKTITKKTAAYLTVASGLKKSKSSPVEFISRTSKKSDIQMAQRLLRFLSLYKGRTDGVYDDQLFAAILKYQQNQKLVMDGTSAGAGKIGPKTKSRLVSDWKKKIVAMDAEKLLLKKKVTDTLATKGDLIDAFMAKGQSGDGVRAAQLLLAQQGFFPKEKVNGNFGDLTKESVMKYQLARGLIVSKSDAGAGTVGPATLKQMRSEQIDVAFKLVRAEGLKAM